MYVRRLDAQWKDQKACEEVDLTVTTEQESRADDLASPGRTPGQMAATAFGLMVTHDAAAAAFADVVVFLRDGHLVGQLVHPTAELVFDQIRALEV